MFLNQVDFLRYLKDDEQTKVVAVYIENIKNPTSGHIMADSIGSITIDENVRQPNNCVIETRK